MSGTPPRDELPADEILVARLRAGDEETFARVVDGWSAGMHRVARSIVSSDASANDVVQDAWLSVITALPEFEGRCRLRTWVYRIVVNAAKRRAHHERRTVPWSSLADDDSTGSEDMRGMFQGPDDPSPGHWQTLPPAWPEQALDSTEVRAVVDHAVEALPVRQRTVITLRDIEGCDAAEVCDLLGISAGHQRVLLHRARTSVRGAVAAYFETGGVDDADRPVP